MSDFIDSTLGQKAYKIGEPSADLRERILRAATSAWNEPTDALKQQILSAAHEAWEASAPIAWWRPCLSAAASIAIASGLLMGAQAFSTRTLAHWQQPAVQPSADRLLEPRHMEEFPTIVRQPIGNLKLIPMKSLREHRLESITHLNLEDQT